MKFSFAGHFKIFLVVFIPNTGKEFRKRDSDVTKEHWRNNFLFKEELDRYNS